jgi:hypothetical protein
MNRQEYVSERSQRDPRFKVEHHAATAELELAEVLARRRRERGVPLAKLSDIAGIPTERLEAIDAGESMTFHEVLWLLRAIETAVTIDPGFRISAHVLVK